MEPAPFKPANRGQVLVVDDEPAIQMLSRLQLKALGCTTTVVSSGEEAVALFVSAKKENRPSPFDVVLSDMIMQGLDGMATSREIRNLYPEQNIVIVSGYAPGVHAGEVARLGLSWLVKPYTLDDLARHIQTDTMRKPA